jgi:hypothetical protein
MLIVKVKIAKHFDVIYPNLKIKQPLVSAWVKEEERWQEKWVAVQYKWRNMLNKLNTLRLLK